MCDQLASDFGIFARRINNNSPAHKPQEFTNQDAERWFSFRRALEKRLLILPADGELMKQLSSRRLQYDHKARMQLEPKDSMRTRGGSLLLTGLMRWSARLPPWSAWGFRARSPPTDWLG